MPFSTRSACAFTMIFAFAVSACGDDGTGLGGDDALVFANSSGAEVTVVLTLPTGDKTNITLPASTTAGETRVDVSFVQGHVYSFVLSNESPSIANSPTITCTVSEKAAQDGVASILVYLDPLARSFTGDCLTNWVESI